MVESKNTGDELTIKEVQALAHETMEQLKAKFVFDRSSKLNVGGEVDGDGLNCLTSSIIYSDRLKVEGVTAFPVYLPKRHFSSGQAFHFGVVVHGEDNIFIADPTLLKEGYGYCQIGTPTHRDGWVKEGNIWMTSNSSGANMDAIIYPYFVVTDVSFLGELNNLMSDVLLAIRGKIEFQKGQVAVERMLDLPVSGDFSPIKAEIYHTVGKLMHVGGLAEEAFRFYIQAHKVGVLTERPLKKALELQLNDQDRVWVEGELRSVLQLKSEEIGVAISIWFSKAEEANQTTKDRGYYLSLVRFYKKKLEDYKKFLGVI